MALIGFERKGIVLGGAIALALLILPVIIITTREAVRAVPNDIRFGSLALGATQWQTTWRQTLPSSIPGIATGTILGLSRAIGEAAPLLLLGIAGAVRFDPTGVTSPVTALPIQIFSMTSQSQEAYQTGRRRGHRRPARDGAAAQRPGHLHPQQVPARVVSPMATRPATFTSTESFSGSLDTYMSSIVDVQPPSRARPPAGAGRAGHGDA